MLRQLHGGSSRLEPRRLRDDLRRARSARELNRPTGNGLIDAGVPLGIHHVTDALLVPATSRSVYRDIEGAVFDAEWCPVESAFLTRTWRDGQITSVPDISGLDVSNLPVVEGTCLFGGYFFHHFGHFILETLARLWALPPGDSTPVVWLTGGPVEDWQREILDMLEVTAPMVFLDRPTKVRELLVPDPGFRIQGQAHPRHIAYLGRYQPAIGCAASYAAGVKVWLSRGYAAPDRCAPQEGRLEAVLRENGCQVVYPEKLEVCAQLDVLADARVVAGLEGSAFHAAMLVAGPSAPLIVLRQTLNRNFAAIARAKGFLEIDLYGAYLIDDRFSRDLASPERSARCVEEVAAALLAGREPAELVRRRYEAQYSYDNWRRR